MTTLYIVRHGDPDYSTDSLVPRGVEQAESVAKKLYELGRIEVASLVEETHSPAECTEVYARLAVEKAFPMVQFDWRRL